MNFFKKLRNEFIDIIEWVDESGSDTLVHKFERYQNEIKNGAKLTVRPGQVAILVNEGQLADIYAPGMHTLTTQNMPVLSTLKGWKYAFNSPFKVDVFFVNTRQFTDRKWGTKNPVMMRDPELGPVRIRAFGNFTFQVSDPGLFLSQVVGAVPKFSAGDITEQLRNIIVTRFSDAMGESAIPVLDKAGKYNEYSAALQSEVSGLFSSFGLTLNSLLIENISLPPEVEAVLDKRTSMGLVGNLQAFTQFQAAQAMEKAAQNESGTAGAGMGLGMGMVMAQQMQGGAGASVPPPIPNGQIWFVAKDQQQLGPFDAATLQQMAQTGALQRTSLVWKQGMAQWTAAGEVTDLHSLWASMPPPIP